jgi:hypothetical protein
VTKPQFANTDEALGVLPLLASIRNQERLAVERNEVLFREAARVAAEQQTRYLVGLTDRRMF